MSGNCVFGGGRCCRNRDFELGQLEGATVLAAWRHSLFHDFAGLGFQNGALDHLGKAGCNPAATK